MTTTDVGPATRALDRIVLTRKQIQLLVAQMATRIDRDYLARTGSPLCLVPILDSAFYFAADLSRELLSPHQIKFVAYYLSLFDVAHPSVAGLDVLLIDIMADSAAMKAVIERLAPSCPRSVHTCALVVRKGESRPDYFGHVFEGEEFLYGYGLDIDGSFRHLSTLSYAAESGARSGAAS